MRLPSKIGLVMMLTANNVSPAALVETVYSVTVDSIETAHNADEGEPDGKSTGDTPLSEYECPNPVANYPNNLYVGVTEEGLFALSLLRPDTASAMEQWVREDGDRFRRKRGDNTLAEAIDFERNELGRIKSLMHRGYRSKTADP